MVISEFVSGFAEPYTLFPILIALGLNLYAIANLENRPTRAKIVSIAYPSIYVFGLLLVMLEGEQATLVEGIGEFFGILTLWLVTGGALVYVERVIDFAFITFNIIKSPTKIVGYVEGLFRRNKTKSKTPSTAYSRPSRQTSTARKSTKTETTDSNEPPETIEEEPESDDMDEGIMPSPSFPKPETSLEGLSKYTGKNPRIDVVEGDHRYIDDEEVK